MMLLLLALQAAAPAAAPSTGIDGSPFDAIPRQQLPDTGCAAFLWSVGERHALVAMATADAGRLRVSLDGRPTDLVRDDQSGAASFGLAATTRYRAGATVVTLDVAIIADPSLTQGGRVPSGTLTITRPGVDSVVVPVAGLIGCAGAPAGGPGR